jgi:oxaloacetate decarboxylase alpha subunit
MHRPVQITDTTLRDAHQSLWATRMRTPDIMGIIDVIDAVGYHSLEVWGGATFDVCLRFLREDPWERLRQVKARARKTPLQMLLRGQNLVGYRNYADDVVDKFVALACKNGVDIFRVFDALNDSRNVEAAIRAVKKYGGHAQGTLCYTVSPVHTIREYVRKAKELVAIGVDSLCIKDMAGILTPITAEKLVTALTKAVSVPIQLHCHETAGLGVPNYVEGVRAGAATIDCAISVMSGFSSQPPVETLLSIFEETPHRAALDRDALRKVCKYFEKLTPLRRQGPRPANIIDPEVLIHHIPGGMISNFLSQLKQQDALDRLDEVLKEVPRVREDFGYPPLVTPTSQIVGTQAVLNVMAGERYKMVPQEVRDYMKGLYGRPPAPIRQRVRAAILGDEQTITCRPADLLEPMLEKARESLPAEFRGNEEDLMSYCLLPEPALEFFKWRALPPHDRPPCPADSETVKQTAPPAKSEASPPAPAVTPVLERDNWGGIRELLERAYELSVVSLTFRRADFTLSMTRDPSAPCGKAVAMPDVPSK